MNPQRPYDVVLFGATGFTGRQTAEYFRDHTSGLRWAIAGRSADKLDRVHRELGLDGVGSIVADSRDAVAVDAMARDTAVLLSTAGPFAKYGDPVVEACVENRTHYVDITGETPWVRTLIDRWHERAAADGTRIVPFCGFDAVPSDLGAWMVASWIRREWSQPTRRIRASFRLAGGGLNGGTLASALNMAESGQGRALGDVLLLNPAGHRSRAERARSRDWREVAWDEQLGCYLVPFMMGQICTRVVRRSNALLGYGENFAYAECMEVSRRFRAWTIALGLAGFSKLLRSGLGRKMLGRFGPAPGHGPTAEQMNSGWFRVRLLGEAADGRKALGTVTSQGDAGNRSTVRMVCESALALALDLESLPGGPEYGGVLTPATALGDVLLRRLSATGEMTFATASFGDG